MRPAELPGLYERLVSAAQSIPGVRSAAVAECGLSAGCQSIGQYRIEGYEDRAGDGVEIRGNRIGPEYFSTIGVRLLEGREFDEHDTENAPGVAIVTRSMVVRYFGGRSPLGKRIGYRPPGREIIGVVEDARVEDLHADPVPMVYTPIAQSAEYAYSLEVRVDGDPHRIAPMLQQVIGRREPRLAIFNSLAIDERLRQNVRRDTLVVSLTTGFGLLALLLASLGLYGVLAYVVAKRAPEIGVRMALGARPGDVSRMVVADGMRVVLAGVVLGAVATVGAGHIVESMLFNVSLVEPTTSLGVLTLLAVTALGACYFPARRASRVDPVTALRAE